MAHDLDRPFDAPSGPGSVRAMPTMTPAGEGPCCTNNLKQIGLATHYNQAPPEDGMNARTMPQPSMGGGSGAGKVAIQEMHWPARLPNNGPEVAKPIIVGRIPQPVVVPATPAVPRATGPAALPAKLDLGGVPALRR